MAKQMWLVTGETYAHQMSLRRLGMTWAPKLHGYVTDSAEQAGKVNATYLGRRAGRELSVRELTAAEVAEVVR